MAVSSEYLQYVLEQLSGLHGVTARRMFGGFGLYCEQRFFGIITSDTLYFKVNDANRGDYQARGMAAFRPPSKPQISVSYFEVPADTIEDADEIVAWAAKSVAAANVGSQTTRTSRALKAKPKSRR